MYSPAVMDHFQRPRNAGKPSEFNLKGVSGNPNAGPFMILYLNAKADVIENAGFETFGCGPAIAAGSILTELIKNKTFAEAALVDKAAILGVMGELPLGKLHCVDLAVNCLADAIRGAGEGK